MNDLHEREKPEFSGWEVTLLERAKKYLQEHYQTATLTDVAAHVKLSPFHFHRRFSKWAGQTPKAMAAEAQVKRAQELMREGKLPMVEISRACGFAHQSHMVHRFRQLVGATPGRWLRAQRIRKMDEAPYAALKAA